MANRIDEPALARYAATERQLIEKPWVLTGLFILPVVLWAVVPPVVGWRLPFMHRAMCGIWMTMAISALSDLAFTTRQPLTRTRKIAAVGGTIGPLLLLPMYTAPNWAGTDIVLPIAFLVYGVGLTAQFVHLRQVKRALKATRTERAEG